MESIAPSKTVRCFSNNKPWLTKHIKALLNRNKCAFMSKDREDIKSAKKELKKEVRRSHKEYKTRVESKLEANNIREVWRGLRTITGQNQKGPMGEGGKERANKLNFFFNRFDVLPPPLRGSYLPHCHTSGPQRHTRMVQTH